MKQLRVYAAIAMLVAVPKVVHAQTMATTPKTATLDVASVCLGDQAQAVSLSYANTSRTQAPVVPPFKHGDHVRVTGVIKNPCSKDTKEIAYFIVKGTAVVQSGSATLGPGETKSVTYEWVAPRGVHTFRVVADPMKKFNEANRANNTRTATITVSQ